MTRYAPIAAGGAGVLVLLALLWWFADDATPTTAAEGGRVAVRTAAVEHGPIENLQEFSGSLEASARSTVAAKIAGRITEVAVDIGDTVVPGDVLARLDAEEYRQAVAEAEAQLEVARAERSQADSEAGTAARSLERVRSLNRQGIAAAAELDSAESAAVNAQAARSVARAAIARAEAQLETARIRLGYTVIRADWQPADAERRVGERMVEPGDTVAANTPLLQIVDVTPLTAVIQVPERLFAALAVGQSARLRLSEADDRAAVATIERIAPVFDPDTRRARVELAVPNEDGRLAPGMFVTIALVAEALEAAAIVPRTALVRRGGDQGVFTVDSDSATAHFLPVTVAFTNAEVAALSAPARIEAPVVTLGQAQLEDGIAVSLGDDAAGDTATETAAGGSAS